jgi:colanic acid biosynthesis protein WcaH
MHLPLSTFKTIIEFSPLVSIDFVIYNKEGRVLLGYRNNRPAKGYWFVPGGRIQKNESMSAAFKRLSLNELGIELSLTQAQLIGPFEHFYMDNVTEDDFSTHYIALGYRLVVDERVLILPSEQHSKYTWMTVEELLVNTNVHKHSRWYFDRLAK